VTDTALIRLSGVTKTFGQGQAAFQALKGIDLAVEAGDFVAIMGPSGSGKSTAMNIIGCLDTPTGGSYEFEGVHVERLSRDQRALLRRNYLGFVFQGFNLLARTTALENVELPLIYRGESFTVRHAAARAALEQVGLTGWEDHTPAELSGGQQQRVAIARSLVMEPQILLMDEPFSALDEPTRMEMQELIVQLWHRIQPTILCVTHNVTEAVYLGERVWIFTHTPGQIAYDIGDTLPHSVGIPPLTAQERPEFKHAVYVVTEAFRRVSENAP